MEESPELKPFVDAANRSPLKVKMFVKLGRPLITSGEVRPTDICAAIAPDRKGNRSAYPMVWGFTGKQSTLFNARVESAGQKPLWKESFERRRCIVPASWYFEWQHLRPSDGRETTGQKYMIQPKGATITLLAGIYRIEDGFPHFAILTREPDDELRFIHDRMPVILDAKYAEAWIKPFTTSEQLIDILAHSLTRMVYEKAK